MRGLHSEFVDRPIATNRTRFRTPTRILITAPHAACDASDAYSVEVRDPLSGRLARDIAHGVASTCIEARVHRRVVDQNRLWGLYTAGDMAPELVRYRRAVGHLEETLHLDVHTFTSKRPLQGWGSGINLVVMHNAPEQKRIAHAFAAHVDRELSGAIPPTMVIEMDARPTHATDDNSNALIEWSRSHGATSLLCELPTTSVQQRCALDECWRADSTKLVEAIVKTLSFLTRRSNV